MPRATKKKVRVELHSRLRKHVVLFETLSKNKIDVSFGDAVGALANGDASRGVVDALVHAGGRTRSVLVFGEGDMLRSKEALRDAARPLCRHDFAVVLALESAATATCLPAVQLALDREFQVRRDGSGCTKVSVLPVSSMDDVAKWLVRMTKWRPEPTKALTRFAPAQYPADVLGAVPGLGEVKAEAIMAEYRSLDRLAAASAFEWDEGRRPRKASSRDMDAIRRWFRAPLRTREAVDRSHGNTEEG